MLPFDRLRLSETPPDLLDAALCVAELPLRVHPLVGKRPVLADWPARASCDPDEVGRRLASCSSYGVVCDEVAVVDTDSRDLAVWWYRNMPETPWTVQTPSGGTHFYYRAVPGLRNAVKAGRGWDVRAGGRGYVVGFGSQVAGRRYELVGEATLDLPEFDPLWLPSEPAQTAVEPVAVGRNGVNESRSIRNIRAYVRRILSVQGQNGSGACFRVACVIRDEGYAPEDALLLMQEWNAACAFPPWSEKELVKKIRDAFSKTLRGG